MPERLVLESGDLLAGEHGLRVEADGLGDVGRHIAVIAADDLDADAQRGEVADGPVGVGPGRVEE
ncbi:hypothetical protein D3C84_1152230 [compost metagenome]